MDEKKRARFVGWFSIGLGVTALALIYRSKLARHDRRRAQDYSHFEQRSGYDRERLGQVLA